MKKTTIEIDQEMAQYLRLVMYRADIRFADDCDDLELDPGWIDNGDQEEVKLIEGGLAHRLILFETLLEEIANGK